MLASLTLRATASVIAQRQLERFVMRGRERFGRADHPLPPGLVRDTRVSCLPNRENYHDRMLRM